MGNWYVVDNFGNVIAGPFMDKQSAEMMANNPNWTVVYKGQIVKMAKKIVIYCYRMTHDYGINTCAFTEKYEPTPDLMTEGGCMSRIRKGIYKEQREKIREETADAYLMAIAGHSRDNGKTREKRGAFISPKYQHLIFVAKISDVISRTDYLTGPLSVGWQDALAYKKRLAKSWNR